MTRYAAPDRGSRESRLSGIGLLAGGVFTAAVVLAAVAAATPIVARAGAAGRTTDQAGVPTAQQLAQAAATPVSAKRFDGLPPGAVELPALRTRTSDTFRAPAPGRGSFAENVAVISRDSINYRDADGVWQPIDDTLVAEAGGYTNRA